MLTVDREHYAGLLRLAYLVLDDGDAPLARARRAAGEAIRARRGGYPAMRARLVATLLSDPPAGTGRLHRLFFESAQGAPGPVRAALRELPRDERLAYLLRRDGLTVPEVVAELGPRLGFGFQDVEDVTAAVDERTGLDEDAQRAELEAFEPDLVRLRPPPRVRPAWIVAVAAVLAVALAAALAATRPGTVPEAPVAVAPDAWRGTPAPSINEWPAQGGLRHDEDLLRRAAEAWRAHDHHPPAGRMVVLYAGEVDGATLVVLRDSPGGRDAPSVAQYFERNLSRGIESVRRLGTGAGQLILLGMTWRYLVPPWIGDVRAAVPSEDAPGWQPLPVRDGLTDPVPWDWYTRRCQNYVVFQMTSSPASGVSRTVTQLASHDPASAAPRVSFRGPEEGWRFRWAALRAVACEGARTLVESGDLLLGRLWSGELPDGGGRASLLTVDAAARWAAPGTAILVSGDGRALSERGGTNSDTTPSTATMAAALWWRSSGRWHLVAAAGPGVERLQAVGELGAHEAEPDRAGAPFLLTVPGPRTGAPPGRRRLPVVRVVAYEPDGDRTVVSPS